jgi:hypothetical protein
LESRMGKDEIIKKLIESGEKIKWSDKEG